MYDSILVPIDGSDESMAAVEEGARMATVHGAALYVLYVVDTNAAATDAAVDVLAHLEEFGEGAIDRARSVATEVGVGSVNGAVVLGTPVREILDHVEDEGIDLVVMGTHGRSGLNRLLLGSVTEKVIRASPVPVLTVRTHESEHAE